jgi:replicative DNA helicase
MAGAAIESGENVAFISLEMSQSELATRLLSIVSGEDVRELEQGNFYNAIAFGRARKVMGEIAERTGAKVFVNRRSVSSLDQIRSAFQYQHQHNGCTLVITDYMQLAHVNGSRNDVERITEVSGVVRRTAKEENVTSVALSQYNRETSKDRDNPPTPQGLHGGSALENDSDQVLLLDHTEYKREPSGATTRLLLAKNRHGPQMILGVRFNYRTLSVNQTEIISDMRRKDKQPPATPPKGPPPIRSAHPERRIDIADRGEAWEDVDGEVA